jgi:hypothetical protein
MNCYKNDKNMKKILICIFTLLLLGTVCYFAYKYNNLTVESNEKSSPLDYSELLGKWTLAYPQNYGYEFTFLDDYNAEITLHLNDVIIKFKGKFSLEDSYRIRVTLFEMMQKDEITVLEKKYSFTPVRDSYFLFKGKMVRDSNPKTLILNPIKIITEGRDSEGYFEPQIRLKKQ